MRSKSPSDQMFSSGEAIGRSAQNIAALLYSSGSINPINEDVLPKDKEGNILLDNLRVGSIVPSLTDGYRMPERSLSWAASSYLTPVSRNDLSNKAEHLKNVDSLTDGFLYNPDQISSYASKEIVLDEFFHNISFNQNYISMRIFNSLLKGEVNIGETEKERLLGSSNAEDTLNVLRLIREGAFDPKKKAFIQALIEIENKNEDLAIGYRKLISKQNPLIGKLEEIKEDLLLNPSQTSMGEYFLAGKAGALDSRTTLTSFDALRDHDATIEALEKEYPEEAILLDMERIQQFSRERNPEDRMHLIPRKQVPKLFDNNLFTYYEDKMKENNELTNSNETDFTQTDSFIADMDLLKKKILIQKVQNKHNVTVDGIRELLMQSFFTEGGFSLSEIIPSEQEWAAIKSEKGSSDINSKIDKISANFSSSLRKGLSKMDQYRLTQMGIDEEELIDIGVSELKKFFLDGKYMDLVMHVDNSLMNSIDKSSPPGAAQENLFQKMLIDGMYNSVMKNTGGTEDYISLLRLEDSSANVENKDIVNIENNIQNGFYLSSGNSENAALYSSAVEMHNLTSMFKKAHDQKMSQGGAETILDKGTDFLTPTAKAALAENIETFYDENSLTEGDLGRNEDNNKTAEAAVKDFISSSNAKSIHSNLYGDSVQESITGLLNLHSKRGLDMLACLEKADSPSVKSQTTTSETRACVQSFIKELEQENKELKSKMNDPVLAMCGIVAILIWLSILRDNKINKLKDFDMQSLWEESRAISFIAASADPEEKLFREKQVITDKNIINDGVIGLGKLDEYVFRSIKAAHDFQNDLNPFLGPTSEGLQGIRSSFDMDTLEETTKEQLVDILEKTNLKESFNTFTGVYSEKIVKDHINKYEDLKRSLDLSKHLKTEIQKIPGFSILNPETDKEEMIEKINIASLLAVESFFMKVNLEKDASGADIAQDNVVEIAGLMDLTNLSAKRLIEKLESLHEELPNKKEYILKIISQIKKNENSIDKNKEKFLTSPMEKILEFQEENFRDFSDNILKSVTSGGMPPSKFAKILDKINRPLKEKIEQIVSLKESVKKEIETIHADIQAKESEIENLPDTISIEEKDKIIKELSTLKSLETIRLDSLAKKTKEIEGGIRNIDKITEMNTLLEKIIRGGLNSTSPGDDMEGALGDLMSDRTAKGVFNEKKMQDTIDILYSQKYAYSGKTDDPDNEEAKASFKARYSSDMASMSLFQDLHMLDEYNKMLHSPYDMNGRKMNAPVPLKNKRVSESIAAMKSSLIEAYVSSQLIEDSSATRSKILKTLYKENREAMIDTSHLHFGFNKQEDGENMQVLIVDKTENYNNIQESIKSINAVTGEISDKELGPVYAEIDLSYDEAIKNANSKEAIKDLQEEKDAKKKYIRSKFEFLSKSNGQQYLEYLGGVSASSTKYTSTDTRGSKQSLKAKNVNLMNRWTEKSLHPRMEELLKSSEKIVSAGETIKSTLEPIKKLSIVSKIGDTIENIKIQVDKSIDSLTSPESELSISDKDVQKGIYKKKETIQDDIISPNEEMLTPTTDKSKEEEDLNVEPKKR